MELRRLFDEKGFEGCLCDVTGNRCHQAARLGTFADQDRRAIDLGRENVEPAGPERGPVQLELKPEVVDERKRRTTVDKGAEESCERGLERVIAELGTKCVGLLFGPPPGRGEEELDGVGFRSGLEVEELGKIGHGDRPSRDLLHEPAVRMCPRNLEGLASGADAAAGAEVGGERPGFLVARVISQPDGTDGTAGTWTVP